MTLFKNWKTTSGGIGAITGGLCGFYFGYQHGTLNETTVPAFIASILTGVGLLFARDATTTSVDMGLEGVKVNSKGDHVITPVGPKASDELHEKLPELVKETKVAEAERKAS